MIHKNRCNRRRQNYYKSKRKSDIAKEIGWGDKFEGSILQYSKAKIHCSCCLCAAKTGKHFGKSSNSIHSWKASDRRKLNKCNYQIESWEVDYE